VEHQRGVTCDAGQTHCQSITLLREIDLSHPSYIIEVEFLEATTASPILPGNTAECTNIGVSMEIGYVSEDYSSFEMAFKYTFFALSLVTGASPLSCMSLAYLCLQRSSCVPLIRSSLVRIHVLLLFLLLFLSTNAATRTHTHTRTYTHAYHHRLRCPSSVDRHCLS
jgi:hypothetical protein